MKNKLMTIAIALALVILLARVFEKPLLAQIGAALVQNVDEPGRNPFQLTENVASAESGSATFTVPVGKRYVIESYSAACQIYASDDSMSSLTIVAIHAGVSGAMYAPAYQTSTIRTDSSFGKAFAADGNSRLYADPGTIIKLSAQTYSPYTPAVCTYTVSGYSIGLYTAEGK